MVHNPLHQQYQHQLFRLTSSAGNSAVRQRVQDLSRELELLRHTAADDDFGGDEADEDNSVLFDSTAASGEEEEGEDEEEEGERGRRRGDGGGSRLQGGSLASQEGRRRGGVPGAAADDEEPHLTDTPTSKSQRGGGAGDDRHHGIPRCISPRSPVHMSPLLSPPTSPGLGGGGGSGVGCADSIFRDRSASAETASSIELFLSMSESSSTLGAAGQRHQRDHQRHFSPATRLPIALDTRTDSGSSNDDDQEEEEEESKPLSRGAVNISSSKNGNPSPSGAASTASSSSAGAREEDYQAVLQRLLDWTDLDDSLETEEGPASKPSSTESLLIGGGGGASSAASPSPEKAAGKAHGTASAPKEGHGAGHGAAADDLDDRSALPSQPWARVATAAALAVALGTLGCELFAAFSVTGAAPGGGSSSPPSLTNGGSTRASSSSPHPWALLSSTLAVAASWLVHRQQEMLVESAAKSAEAPIRDKAAVEKALKQRKQQLLASNTHYRSRIVALEATARRLQTLVELAETRKLVAEQQRRSVACAVLRACCSCDDNDNLDAAGPALEAHPWPTRLRRLVAAVPGCAVDSCELEAFVAGYCADRNRNEASVASGIQQQQQQQQQQPQGKRRGIIKTSKLTQQKTSPSTDASVPVVSDLTSTMLNSRVIAGDDAKFVAKLVREALSRDSRIFVITMASPRKSRRTRRRRRHAAAGARERGSGRVESEGDTDAESLPLTSTPPCLPSLDAADMRNSEEKKEEEDGWWLSRPATRRQQQQQKEARGSDRNHPKERTPEGGKLVSCVSLGAAKMPTPSTPPTPAAAVANAGSGRTMYEV